MAKTQLDTLTQAFLNLLKDNAKSLGEELKADLSGVQSYVAQRMDNLTLAVSQPGFTEVVKAERDNVALKVAARAVAQGDQLDARFTAFISGALSIAAHALTGL